MWIDIDDAVRIYARMLRARLGPIRGAKAALGVAHHSGHSNLRPDQPEKRF
jgi:hypothetical protein